MWHVAEAFHFGFKVPDLLVLPAKNIAPDRVPGYAVVETNRFCCGKDHLRHHHLGRLDVVAANLVYSERDSFLLASVLALDYQHRDTVNKKDHILTRSVAC